MKRSIYVVLSACLVLALVSSALAAKDENLEAIQKAIKAKGLNWKAGPAFFGEQDFRAKLGVNKPFELDKLFPIPDPPVDIPSSFDWRSQNAVTSVKDQELCGGCWAFASVAGLESAAIRQGGYSSSLNLSEQYLVSTCYPTYDCDGSYSVWEPVDFLVDTGTVDEACFPYQGHNSSCTPCGGYQNRMYSAANRGSVSQDVNSMKQAIYQHGPLVTTMDVYEDFDYYEDGVYEYAWGGYAGSHAILLVGYSDSGSYFIVKNSWGSYWGESGYFRISYNEVNGYSNLGWDTQWMNFGDGPDDDDDDDDDDNDDDNNDNDDNDDNDNDDNSDDDADDDVDDDADDDADDDTSGDDETDDDEPEGDDDNPNKANNGDDDDDDRAFALLGC
jgi:hypothetical protein